MNDDPTVRDVIDSVKSAPTRLLNVRLSTIWRGLSWVVRVPIVSATYVLLVLLLAAWFHASSKFYIIALAVAPLYWLREWWREREG
jgi:hypothetical protein